MYDLFNGEARGPLFGPNSITIGYNNNGEEVQVQIFPDVCNDDLRRSGKPMKFYIVPGTVRMAKDTKGKYIFSFTKFLGVLDEGSNIGVTGQEQVAGGVLSLTATLALPDGAVESIKEKLIEKIKTSQQFKVHTLFNLFNEQGDNVAPTIELGFVPITKNVVAMSSLTMNDLSDPSKQTKDDKWLWRAQGNGDGNITPTGTNAFTSMLGQFPAGLVEAGFKGDTAPIFIHNALQLRFWAPPTTIKVEADFSRIFHSFKSNSKFKGNWYQQDIKTAFDSTITDGACKITILMGDMDISDKESQFYIEMANQAKKSMLDLVMKNMFTSIPKSVEAANAADTRSITREVVESEWYLFWGSSTYGDVVRDTGESYALNTSYDVNSMHLGDTTTIIKPFFLNTVVSGNMNGFYDEMQQKPEAKNEYFSTVNFGETFKMSRIIATARANWPSADGKTGDPIDKLQMSVAVYDQNGKPRNLMARSLDPKTFTFSERTGAAIWTEDNKSTQFVFDFAYDENVPVDKRSKVIINRTICYKQDPRVKINTDNIVVLPEEITESKFTPEVSANIVGHLNVGPIYFAADLNKHMQLEVTFKKKGFKDHTMFFNAANVNEKQSFELWTNETGTIDWSYKVKVVYKSFGPLSAIQYEGEEINMSGSYATGISIDLPAPPQNIIEQLTQFKAKAKELEALDA
jgi:hypothetical protein